MDKGEYLLQGCFDAALLARLVGEILRERDATLAVAESCTGGLLGGRITEVSGSSAYFRGGVIAYGNAVKARVLGVPAALLERDGAVSRSVVLAMASGARRLLDADFAVAITGIAGPGGGSVSKPVGTVWLGLAQADGSDAVCLGLPDEGRRRIRERAVGCALEYFRGALEDVKWSVSSPVVVI